MYKERQRFCFETDRSKCAGVNARGLVFDRQNVSCSDPECVGKSINYLIIQCRYRHLCTFSSKLNQWRIYLTGYLPTIICNCLLVFYLTCIVSLFKGETCSRIYCLERLLCKQCA